MCSVNITTKEKKCPARRSFANVDPVTEPPS